LTRSSLHAHPHPVGTRDTTRRKARSTNRGVIERQARCDTSPIEPRAPLAPRIAPRGLCSWPAPHDEEQGAKKAAMFFEGESLKRKQLVAYKGRFSAPPKRKEARHVRSEVETAFPSAAIFGAARGRSGRER